MLDSLSVVVPTRNEADRIAELLASLPATVELIVVDASTDTTPDVIQALRPERTRVLRSSAGIAEARQIGAQAATGDWLLFSDADVCFLPGYFESITSYFSADAFFGPKYCTQRHPIYDYLFNTGQRVCKRMGIPAASGSNMAVRRSVFNAVGGFRCDLPVNEDTELFLRIAHHGYNIAYAPDLGVRSLDDRRLDRGATRKMLHSVARSTLIMVNLRVSLPKRWLQDDWGYWRQSGQQSNAQAYRNSNHH